MKNLLYAIALSSLSTQATAQPSIQWQKSLGGTADDRPYVLQNTNDGGSIVVGRTSSTNGNVIGNHGKFDVWVVKLNESGNPDWKKAYGGSDDDTGYYIQKTSDGGYIITGSTYSNDGDVSGNHGGSDVWVLKISDSGTVQWQKTFGGTMDDSGFSIQETNDGGYIILGNTSSNDGDVSGNHGVFDMWLVKISSLGTIEWQKTLGGSSYDSGTACEITSDGGYILDGQTRSANGDVTVNHGGYDIWLVKVSDLGEIEWQKTFGGSKDEYPGSIQQTNEGGYIAFGTTSSGDGDIIDSHGLDDCWVLKLSNAGAVEWNKTYGGSSFDASSNILQTNDGGYILAGETSSIDGDVSDDPGSFLGDCWVFKINATGSIEWQETLGGTMQDWVAYLQITSDGGYVMACYIGSNDGDVWFNHGFFDFWIVKLSPDPVGVKELHSNQAGYLTIFPNPATSKVFVEIPSGEPILTITIADAQGRTISQQAIPNGKSMDVSSLPNGIYSTLATTPSGHTYSNKLTIQK